MHKHIELSNTKNEELTKLYKEYKLHKLKVFFFLSNTTIYKKGKGK